jgi:hypothetical protein
MTPDTNSSVIDTTAITAITPTRSAHSSLVPRVGRVLVLAHLAVVLFARALCE